MGLQILTYACFVGFLVAAGARIYRQLTLPMHFRWELYPVQSESGGRAKYGGSYMEESDWWSKPRVRSWVNEIKYMLPEIFLLRGLREENRRLWNVSFPFHLGLYLLFGTLFLLLIGGVAMIFGVPVVPGNQKAISFLYYLTMLAGGLGLILGTVGTVGLLLRRIKDPALKGYSAPVDFLNLILFLVFFVVALFAWLIHDLNFVGARAYVHSLLTFGNPAREVDAGIGPLGILSIVLASLILVYIPLTHMSHMFMKYFMYHNVRWEDAPNLKGGRLEAQILKNLGLKPTWAASHVGADKDKTWADIAQPPSKEEK
jgi:nitrate reductase gamma subunit